MRTAAWFLKFLNLINNFPLQYKNASEAQVLELLAGVLKDPGSIPSEEEFFYLHFFSRGNDTNGKEQEQQLQLK